MSVRREYFEALFDFIRRDVAKAGGARSTVERYAKEGGIPPAKTPNNSKYEEICTYLFIAPAIARFHHRIEFREEAGLDRTEIRAGLAYESWQSSDHSDDYGSSPVVDPSFKTLFKKGNGRWTASWSKAQSTPAGHLSNHSPCPDIAFKSPLPYTAVGDCKYFRETDEEPWAEDKVLDTLFKSVRELFDYYGLFNVGLSEPSYESAFLIAVDATKGNRVRKAIRTHGHKELWQRLNTTRGFHLGIVEI